MLEVSMTELKNILIDFHNLTKFKIVLYDADRKPLYSYPEAMCAFCKTVREDLILAKKCIECDNIGFDICDKTRNPYIYECHMSVTEAIAPIYSDEVLVGYLMFGQIRKPECEEIYSKARSVSEKGRILLTEDMIRQIPTADADYIRSAVNMMTMCASYLCTKEIIRRNPNILTYHLEQYIHSHLGGDLCTETLCKRFFISRAKLYQLSKQTFGMGVSDYIRQQRLQKSKKLLLNTADSVSQIALTVGIPDTNYFIRTFKQAEGVTPLQYRKKRLG